MRLLPPDGSLPYDVHRPEVEQKLEMTDALLFPRMMSAKLARRVPLRLSRGAFDEVEAWVGRGRLMRSAVKRRVGILPLLAIVLATPFALAWPVASESGGDPFANRPVVVGLALGVACALAWAAWRLRPRPLLFLLDSALFLAVAALLAWRLTFRWSWFTFLFLLLQVFLIVGGTRLHRRFKAVSPAELSAEPA
jgi:hypothetical protein